MEFSNSFEVSLPPEQAWPWLMDVESMVPCMPGAELVEKREDGSFQGKISVQLGPVRLAFVCDATFAQVDNAGHKAQLQASGADAKGRGTASANIGFRMQPSAQGSKVIIDTDLQLAGAVAQYGRGAGLIQNVANQIISQFARNLESRIGQLKAHAAATGEDYLSRAAASSDETVQATAAPATSAATEDYVNGYKAGYTEGFQAGHAAGYAAALRLAGGSGPASAQARSHGGPPPFPQARPISGFSLFFSSLGQTIAGWFSRRPH